MMSDFKEMLARDIRGVFLDGNEFADWHTVEGKRILAVTDPDALKELKASIDLAESTLLFQAAVEDLPPRRPAGQVLNFDGKEYTIDDWAVNMGMAIIILSEPVVG